jgi:hypothetical protein
MSETESRLQTRTSYGAYVGLVAAYNAAGESASDRQATVRTAYLMAGGGVLNLRHLREILTLAGERSQPDLFWFEEDLTAVADRMMEIREVEGPAGPMAMGDLVAEIQRGVGHARASEIISEAFGIVSERTAS